MMTPSRDGKPEEAHRSAESASSGEGFRSWRALTRRNWTTFGGILALTASVYVYTLYRMRSTAPGDLRKTLPLPPSDEKTDK